MLVDTGRQKIKVIKAIRSFTYLGLAEAKSLAESTPSAVLRGVSEAEATQAAQQLQNQGATVRLRESKTKPNHTAHIKEVDLALIDVGPNKINIIKVVRSLTGLGLAEAKSLVESVPAILLEKVELPAAEDAKRRLEAEGATVEIS
jgi:large subunit ribosomal protein L7/L12